MLEEVRRGIVAANPVRVDLQTVDLRDAAALQALAAASKHVDILVNNAGDIPAARSRGSRTPNGGTRGSSRSSAIST